MQFTQIMPPICKICTGDFADACCGPVTMLSLSAQARATRAVTSTRVLGCHSDWRRDADHEFMTLKLTRICAGPSRPGCCIMALAGPAPATEDAVIVGPVCCQSAWQARAAESVAGWLRCLPGRPGPLTPSGPGPLGPVRVSQGPWPVATFKSKIRDRDRHCDHWHGSSRPRPRPCSGACD